MCKTTILCFLVNKETLLKHHSEYIKQTRVIKGDEIRAKDKQYREQNKAHRQAHATEKIECECGCMSSRSAIARHRKSERHIKLMESKTI